MRIELDLKVTQAEFGDMVGISQPAVSDFIKAANLEPGSSAGVMLLAYCNRLREQAARRLGSEEGGLDLVQERAALARAQRKSYEIKNAVAEGQYAPISLLSEVLALASQAVAERIEQLPGMLKRACPELPEAARDQLMAVLSSARNEWTTRTIELAATYLDDEDAAVADMSDP